MAIKFVYFDVGNVIARDTVRPKLAALAEKYGLNTDKLYSLRSAYRWLADYGNISDCEYWQLILHGAGVNTNDPADCQLTQYIEPVKGTLDIIKQLKKAGYGLGILSDDSFENADERAKKLGYDKLIPQRNFIISSEWGVKKPGPEIYDIAIRTAGVRPEEILFIDDNPDNLAGAAIMGMQTLLFQNADQLEDALTTEYGIPIESSAEKFAKGIGALVVFSGYYLTATSSY